MTIFAIGLAILSFFAGVAIMWLVCRRTRSKQLNAAMAANNAFLSASAHQLRAPLNQIVGSLQALDFQKNGLTKKQEQLIGILNEGSYNLRGSLMDILDILDLQSDRLNIEASKVNFRATLRTLERRFAKRAEKKGLTLSFDTRKLSHWHFEMDQTRYIQCVSTVIAQSIKQTDSGAVSVAFDLTAAGPQSQGYLQAYIKDSSAGMDQYMTESYFRPDKYENNAEMMDTDGRRLSLMLSRMLAEKMGGSLTVKSAFGSGVAFKLSVPVAMTKVPAGEAEPSTAKPVERMKAHLADKTILVVDDDKINLLIMKELLGQGEVGEVLLAANGSEAVEILKTTKCDLVFMDIQMPVMDGIAATREIRESDEAFSKIPIIAMTTSVTREYLVRYKEAGMNAVLPKPVIIDTLYETLETFVVKKKQRDAA
ncbi:response regulator [Marinicaulis aureus]|uniref:histidine kinase n=1 Tax=Hyphococcus aureus TaxID=2666033 RepID=A0ABW1KZF7_9PROT